MAEDDDLITIVDVTDPDDPQYSDMRTHKRSLTAVQLAGLRTILQKVGAYQFFSREFNFSDGPAVLQFIESVEVEDIKPTKTHKVVQDTFKGTVAGREVLVDARLIEKAFGLVDDGENIAKPKGDNVSGLHTFYIKAHHVDECQSKRGVNLAFLKTEYMHLKNFAHQIQVYCCGIEEDDYVKFTVYRALDFVLRGKPVNWNRYILQNMQERIRRYKRSPCPLYFAGMLTALIYKALNLNYELVNKLPPPASQEKTPVQKTPAPSGKKAPPPSSGKSLTKRIQKRTSDLESLEETERVTRSSARVKMRMQKEELLAIEGVESPGSKRRREDEENPASSPVPKRRKNTAGEEGPSSKKEAAAKKKTRKSVDEITDGEAEEKETDAEGDEDDDEPIATQRKSGKSAEKTPATRSSIRVKMRITSPKKASSEKRPTTSSKRSKHSDTETEDIDSEERESDTENEEEDGDGRGHLESSGITRRQGLLMMNGAADIPEVLVNKNYRLSTLYNQAMGTPITDKLPLTESKDLWLKYTQYYALGQECHLEHIISKQKHEALESKVEEMESALKSRDEALSQSTQRVEELESAMKVKDEQVQKLNAEIAALKNKLNR